MKSEIMLESTSLTNLNYNNSPCPFCLAVALVPDRNDCFNETTNSSDIFKKFVIFSNVYLKEKSGEKLFLARALNRPLPRFCEKCEDKVKEILDLHWQLEKLKYKLMWKVIAVGEAITKSQKKIEEWPVTGGCPLNTGLLQVFRKQMARKCKLKAKRILPKVIVRKTEAIGVFLGISNELQAKTVTSKARQMEIQCLIGLIVIHSSIYGWDLWAISEAFPAFKSTSAFERVTADCRTVMIPTRETLRTFTFLLLMYFIAYDWNLEKVTLRNPENTTAPLSQRRIIKRKRGRPPGTRVKIENSSEVLPTNEFAAVVKRGPGRPPRTDRNIKVKKKGRPGRPRKISTDYNIKTELLDCPKRGPGRPKKIKLQHDRNDNDALDDPRESQIRSFASLPVEKAEVEIPSPEPSMVGLSFQDENNDYTEDCFSAGNSPLPQDVNTAPMDIAGDGNTKQLGNQNEASTLISEENAANDPPPQQNEFSSSSNDTERIKRKRGRPFRSTPATAESKSNITCSSSKVKRRPGRPKKKRRGRPPRQNLEHPIKFELAELRRCRRGGPQNRVASFRSIANRTQITSTPNPAGIDLSQKFTIQCTFSGCPLVFKTLLPFLEHLQLAHSKTAHTKENPPSCESCRKNFKSELSLMAHLETDHETAEEEEASHFCFYCHRSFCTAQLAELHRKNIHWFYPQQVPCEVEECTQEFTCTKQLAEHYKTSHCPSDDTSINDSFKNAAELKLYSCEQCHWPFLSKRRLLLHRFNHLVPNEKDKGYQCPSCPNRYITAMKLAAHFNHVAVPYHCNRKFKQRFWNCAVGNCDFFFFSEKEMQAHTKLHEQYSLQRISTKRKPKMDPIERRNSVHPIVCAYCLEPFPSRPIRNAHEETCPIGPSTEQKLRIRNLFGCAKCDYVTNIRGQMHRHTLIHAENKHQCPECGAKFGRSDHLQTHMKRKHSSPENKLVCHLCGVKRASESDMKYHMSEHERRHLCPDCGQKFTRAWLLSVHMRKHTGERIQCEWCPAFYRTVPELKEHYQSRHPEELEKTHGSMSKIRVKYKLVKKDKATSYRLVPNAGEEEAEESVQMEHQQLNSHRCSSIDVNSGEGEAGVNVQEENQTELNDVASASLDSEMVNSHSMQQ